MTNATSMKSPAGVRHPFKKNLTFTVEEDIWRGIEEEAKRSGVSANELVKRLLENRLKGTSK